MSRRTEVMRNFEEHRKFMEKSIQAGIEKNRKGYACLHVVDTAGRPAQDVRVKITQKNHAFKYGANLFMLDEFESTEKNEKYKEFFKDAFNMATLPFYWNDLEPEKGKTRYEKNAPKIYRRPNPDLCLEYCEKYGIEPREHALAYEHFFPDWLKDQNVFTVKRELMRRYAEIARRYADRIRTIEVTNEMFWKTGVTAFYEDDKYVEWCFKLAEKEFPANQLVINEWSNVWRENGRNRDPYYMQIERAIRNGARIDAIGLQFHMFHRKEEEAKSTIREYDPRHLYKILDRYADFGLPIQLTEVTIPAYTAGEEDEKLQAEIIETLYSIWFSHPNVEQIIYWNVVDGYAAFAPQGDMTAGENYYRGGLIRFDMTPKPAYYTVKDLFQKKWHTEKQTVSDEGGNVHFHGFYGAYEIQVEADGKSVTHQIDLCKAGSNEFTIEI